MLLCSSEETSAPFAWSSLLLAVGSGMNFPAVVQPEYSFRSLIGSGMNFPAVAPPGKTSGAPDFVDLSL